MNRLFIRKLREDPDMQQFDCGNGSINDKIKNGYYSTLLKKGYAYEICLGNTTIGHYMLRIVPLEYSSDYTIADENNFSAVKLEYLAIDRCYQRTGKGTAVLKYIVKTVEQYSEQMPIRFLSLDALSEKMSWYTDRGFQVYNPDDQGEENGTVQMYMDFCDMDAVKLYCDSF